MQTTLTYRWLYAGQNLQVTENITALQALLRRAQAAGYNGMVLADYKLQILDRVSDHYFKNLAAVLQTAKECKIAVYPTVCSIGYSNGILAYDPNLAEGLPVKDAPFVMKGGTADIAEAGKNLLVNGDFEQVKSGDTLMGYDFQDGAGSFSFVDKTETHGTGASLRIENPGKNTPSGNARVVQTITVRPFSQVHFSVWVKTSEFDAASDVRLTVLPVDGVQEQLCYNSWQVKRTQEWTQHHAVFNTLNNTKLRLYLGCWGGKTGRLWFDDARFEYVGLLNVLRREGTPFVVRSESGMVYTEGRDYAPVADPKLGNTPYAGEYEVWHPSPQITRTPQSRIREGEHLLVSYYHPVTIYESQVCVSLVHPKTYEILTDQVTRVQKHLTPPGFFLKHDEIRVAGWSDAQWVKGRSSGALLAENTQRCVQLVRRIAGKSVPLLIWSDMYDPYHNAVDNYYLVKGTMKGAWEGLPKDVMVMNWNSGKAAQSLKFFAERGHKQILAGYYDSNPAQIKEWLATAAKLPKNANVKGVMYTTWANNYQDLEAFAQAAWG